MTARAALLLALAACSPEPTTPSLPCGSTAHRYAPFEADELELFPDPLHTIADGSSPTGANARTVAAFLRGHPGVDRVLYPDEPGSPYAANVARYLPLGPGAIMAFGGLFPRQITNVAEKAANRRAS